ncbi:DNA (cytosine-5-)-methyltransferase [Rhizobium ruizarguesonis]
MTAIDADFSELVRRTGLSVEQIAVRVGKSVRTIHRYIDGEVRVPALIAETLRSVADERCGGADRKRDAFTFVDLFAGIGGLRRPFEELGGRCLFTAEWDRFSRETYAANFPEPADSVHQSAGDIRPYAADPGAVPEHDVLLAGFPCQAFSIAGVSKKNALGRPHGFLCDTQGTLFFDLAKIIAHHRPKAFLLENVRNLQSHDGGKTFATIMHVLEVELGYKVQYRVISSEPWVPQKRQRIFIVGFRDDTSFDFGKLEIPAGRKPVLGDILEKDVDPKYTLTAHMWKYLKDYKEKHRGAGNGFGFGLFGPNDVTRTLSARYYKDGSEVLVEQPGKRPRRLTPLECSRLMGFNEPQSSKFVIPVSDTQAYRQFGNAVVVPVVRAVANLMRLHIEIAMDAASAQPQLRDVGQQQGIAA